MDNLEIKDNFVPYKAVKSNEVDEDTMKALMNMNDALSSAEKPRLSNFEKRKQEKRFQKPKTPAIPLPQAYNCETNQLSLMESLKQNKKSVFQGGEAEACRGESGGRDGLLQDRGGQISRRPVRGVQRPGGGGGQRGRVGGGGGHHPAGRGSR